MKRNKLTKFVTVVSAACMLMTAMPVMAADGYYTAAELIEQYGNIGDPLCELVAMESEELNYEVGTNETLETMLERIMVEKDRQKITDDISMLKNAQGQYYELGGIDTYFEFTDKENTSIGWPERAVTAGDEIASTHIFCLTSFNNWYGTGETISYGAVLNKTDYSKELADMLFDDVYIIDPTTGEKSYTYIKGEQRLVVEITYGTTPRNGEKRLLWKTVYGE